MKWGKKKMLNFLIQCGCYNKIYDSYKHDDVYGALYQINLGLANNDNNNKKMKQIEKQVLSCVDDHLRIYINMEGFMKQVMVKQSDKVVMVKWLMMQLPEDSEDETWVKGKKKPTNKPVHLNKHADIQHQ